MQVDALGRAFITAEEGEVLHQYFDAGGRPTIGCGHLLQRSVPGYHITHDESQRLLTADLVRFEQAVSRLVTRPISQNAYNALISFTFNLGEGALQRSSLLRLVNAGVKDPAQIRAAFSLWVNVNGRPNASIKARRLREAALYLTTSP